MNTPSSKIRGFSLIELLVVMLIIGIVAAFIVPQASTIIRGSQMSQASNIITDQFNIARQYALSENHPVEVRLIRYADPQVPGEVVNGASMPSSGNYRAIQILQTLDTVTSSGTNMMIPLDKPQVLPTGVVMNTSVLSTLIMDSQQTVSASNPSTTPSHGTPGTQDPSMPGGIGTNYDFIAFRFMPDGSTNLPSKSISDANGAWFVTLQSLTDHPVGTTPPPNFFTLQVDPVSGTLKEFRPGI